MRASKRKAKREKEMLMKTAGIGAAALATIAGGTMAVVKYNKSKSNKTEDKLENITSPTEE